jgi:hypothetical protein
MFNIGVLDTPNIAYSSETGNKRKIKQIWIILYLNIFTEKEVILQLILMVQVHC